MNFRDLIVHLSFLIAIELPIRVVQERNREDLDTTLPWKRLNCPYDDERVGSDTLPPFVVVYAKYHDNILLPCCKKYNTSIYDSWYKTDRFFLDEPRVIRTKKSFDWNGTDLDLPSFEEKDAGVYYCEEDRTVQNLNTYLYIIDIEYPGAPVVRGDIDVQHEYTKKYLDKVKLYVDNPSKNPNEEIRRIYTMLGLGLRPTIRWDPWTECDYCLGYKARRGRCHIEPYDIDFRCQNECEITKYILHMDCRSHWSTRKVYPHLADMIKDIPDVEAVAKCIGECSDTDIKPGFDYQRKLRNRILTVGSSAILTCPGFTPKKSCFWRRNGIKIEPAEYDSTEKVNLNQLCQMFLEDVTKKQAGNYTCYLDEKFVQENKVIVEESRTQGISEQWWRHRKYLMFVTLLSFIIIAGGIIMACIQRGNFLHLDHETVLNNFRTGQLDFERRN